MSDVRQYLCTIQATRPEMLTTGPTTEEAEIVSRHSAYLEDLTEKGIVILYGRTQNTDESSFGIVIFNAKSEREARGTMENDPAVKHGVMRAKLYPYRIALMSKA